MLRTWDGPNEFWDTAAWDTMQSFYKLMKVKLSLSTLTDDELADLLDLVHSSMTTNAATFNAPNPNMPALAALSTAQRAAIAGRAASLTAADNSLKTLRAASAASRAALSLESTYVENKAAGNEAIITLAGMGVRAAHGKIGSMPKVESLKTTPNDHAGAVDWMCKPVKGASAYIVQVCTGDPLVEANWHYADTVVKSSGTINGLTSGKVFVRMCAKGADTLSGAWSDLAEEMVR